MASLYICFISIIIIAFFIGHLPVQFKMPRLLDFKPFNCQLCLTTWTNFILQTFIALLAESWIYFGLGLIASVVIFILIKREEKKKWM